MERTIDAMMREEIEIILKKSHKYNFITKDTIEFLRDLRDNFLESELCYLRNALEDILERDLKDILG